MLDEADRILDEIYATDLSNAIYGQVTIEDSKLHASILAPTTTLTVSNAIINGSIIVGALRGSVATLNIPYVTC